MLECVYQHIQLMCRSPTTTCINPACYDSQTPCTEGEHVRCYLSRLPATETLHLTQENVYKGIVTGARLTDLCQVMAVMERLQHYVFRIEFQIAPVMWTASRGVDDRKEPCTLTFLCSTQPPRYEHMVFLGRRKKKLSCLPFNDANAGLQRIEQAPDVQRQHVEDARQSMTTQAWAHTRILADEDAAEDEDEGLVQYAKKTSRSRLRHSVDWLVHALSSSQDEEEEEDDDGPHEAHLPEQKQQEDNPLTEIYESAWGRPPSPASRIEIEAHVTSSHILASHGALTSEGDDNIQPGYAFRVTGAAAAETAAAPPKVDFGTMERLDPQTSQLSSEMKGFFRNIGVSTRMLLGHLTPMNIQPDFFRVKGSPFDYLVTVSGFTRLDYPHCLLFLDWFPTRINSLWINHATQTLCLHCVSVDYPQPFCWMTMAATNLPLRILTPTSADATSLIVAGSVAVVVGAATDPPPAKKRTRVAATDANSY